MLQKVTLDLKTKLPNELVDALISAYEEIKHNFFINKYEPSELNGGKFCEACCRIIQFETNSGKYIPLGTSIGNMIETLRDFEKLPLISAPEAYRIHIPRVLISIYNIRNKRGVGHLGGDINPNKADSALILNSVDWVMAELFRVHYQCSLDEAQDIANSIIQRKISLIFDIEDMKRVLLPSLSQRDQTLLLLAAKHPEKVSDQQLISWIEPGNLSSYRSILRVLHTNRLIEYDKLKFCFALPTCIKYVENKYSKWVSKLNKEE